ncbi:MAG: cell division protein SepF [Lachnospiraceae bacterium]|jgi:cell division inhibitor SepF
MGVLDKFLDAIKLNDDYDDYDDEFFDDELDDFEDEKPRKRFFNKMKEDLDDEDDEPVKTNKAFTAKSEKTTSKAVKPAKSSSKITPMRSAKKPTTGMEVCVIKPTSMEDTREIADNLIDGCTVLLNLEGMDVDLAQRIIDFCSGSCYSLGGTLQQVASYIFILTPASVELSGDFQTILGKEFDFPSIRTDF